MKRDFNQDYKEAKELMEMNDRACNDDLYLFYLRVLSRGQPTDLKELVNVKDHPKLSTNERTRRLVQEDERRSKDPSKWRLQSDRQIKKYREQMEAEIKANVLDRGC